jgi:hypothetical protein
MATAEYLIGTMSMRHHHQLVAMGFGDNSLDFLHRHRPVGHARTYNVERPFGLHALG